MEKLNQEDLEEIFWHLPKRDLETATEVCQMWNFIISSSTKFARRLCLVINCKNPEDIHQTLEKSKLFPFRNFVIKNLEDQAEENLKLLKEIFDDQEEYVEKLRFFKCEHDLMVDFFSQSDCFANLTHLALSNVEAPQKDRDLKFDFPCLKYLDLKHGPSFLDVIKTHKIEILKVVDKANNAEKWGQFLKDSPHLKQLSVDFNDSDLIYDPSLIFNFIPNIESLAISVSAFGSTSILPFISDQNLMPKLRNLELDIHTSSLLDFDRFEINAKLEQVECLSTRSLPDIQDTQFYRTFFLTCCPNIKVLKILSSEYFEAPTESEFEYAIKNLKNLEEIYSEYSLEFNDAIVNLMLSSKIRKITIFITKKENFDIPIRLQESNIEIIIKVHENFYYHYEEEDLKDDGYEDFDFVRCNPSVRTPGMVSLLSPLSDYFLDQ